MILPQLLTDLAAALPAPEGATNNVITVIVDDVPIGKRFMLLENGKVDKQATVSISNAVACQFHVPDLDSLQLLLEMVANDIHAAVANCGWSPVPIGEPFRMVSQRDLSENNLDPEKVHVIDGMKMFARLKRHATPSTWQIADRDVDEHTPPWAMQYTYEAWRAAMEHLLPGFSTTTCLRAHSSSARVQHDGQPVGGGNGHTWFKVADPEGLETARRNLMTSAIAAGKAWLKPRFAKDGSGIVGHSWTTICDPATWTKGRLVFNGKPVAVEPLTVGDQQFEVFSSDGGDALTVGGNLPAEVISQALLASSVKTGMTHVHGSTGSRVHNLTPETVLELKDGSTITVAEAAVSKEVQQGGKLRCQAPFRASSSLAAFLRIDDRGHPFVYDSGTGIKHYLPEPDLDHHASVVVNRMVAIIGHSAPHDTDPRLVRYCVDSGLVGFVLSRCFRHAANKSVMVVGKGGNIASFSSDEAIKFALKNHFGDVLNLDLLKAVVPLPKDIASIVAGQYAKVVESIVSHRQVKEAVMQVDMFSRQPDMTFDDGKATITVPHRPFDENEGVSPADAARVWSDFSEHFPEWPNLVRMMLYARFSAATRRRFFAWLQAESDFGKGLIIATLKQLGLVVDMSLEELVKALRGDPSGTDPNSFLRAWVVSIDEWNKVNGDLKKINDSISISAKWAMKMEVPVYLKLFTSAEHVNSLSDGGVEKQFTERFSYLQAPSGKFDLRVLRNELGSDRYRDCLAAALARALNTEVARLQAMGKHAADLEAANWVEAFHAAHLLTDEFGDYEDDVKDAASHLQEMVRDWFPKRDTYGGNSFPRALGEALKGCKVGEVGGRMAVQLSHKVFEEFNKMRNAGSGAAKAAYKTKQFQAFTDEGGTKSMIYRIGSHKQSRGAVVFVDGMGGKMPDWLVGALQGH